MRCVAQKEKIGDGQMAPSAITSTSSPLSLATKSVSRLASIKDHMAGSSPTVFTTENVPQAPEDPLFGLMAAYRKDTFEKKVDLGIGAYRDNNAKPWVLPVVKQASLPLRLSGNIHSSNILLPG